MKIINSNIYEGRNIYSHKKCIKLIVDLEGYCETPSKDIDGFNESLVKILPELNTHRCGIDEEGGFVKRLKEGTYLAHICEHMIICIQNILGMDVAYGKAREIKDDFYMIIYQYMYSKVAIECGKLAVDIINSLINKKSVNFKERLYILKNMLQDEIMGPSAMEICNAAKMYDLPYIKLGSSNFYQIGYGKQGRLIESSIGNSTTCIATDISCDKLLTKQLLETQSIPVAKGKRVTNIKNLINYANEIGYPVVLKPQFGNKGKGIKLNIKDNKELIEKYKDILKEYNDIIIEKYHKGDDYRVCVVNYKVVAVSKRIPPFIIGDGISSINGLINKLNENSLRGEDHEKPLTKVKIDDETIRVIRNQGFELNDVIDKDIKVVLRENANLSTGGTAIDYTDKICNENIELCIRAAKIIGLDICGIDICSTDISKPLLNTGIVLEVNAAPGLRMHASPSEGIKRNIGDEIVKMMYNGKPKNIPIISITGTNGKTTTTRLINSTLLRMGYSTGMTSTEGIFINGKCIDKGDDTGVESAKCILLNKDVEVAVLETARGGIIKKGLAYDLADVAVLTNITEDHLGCNNVNNMEQLCNVKSLVLEAIKPNGYAVVNADDRYSLKIINNIKSKIIYFSKDYKNEFIQKNIRDGEIAVYIKDEYICVNNKNREYKISNIYSIPITLNGVLEFNIENAMASCAALVGLGIDYAMIKIGLESFKLDSNDSCGRFNIYNYNDINVVLDYGHNIEGYRRVLAALKMITKGKIIGVVGIPGDRSDDLMKKIGKISSENIDNIIIKEDIDNRGRAKGEVANLIKDGALEVNKNCDIKIILNELEAFKYALNQAEKNDTVIVFFEKLEPLIDFFNEKSNYSKNIESVVNLKK